MMVLTRVQHGLQLVLMIHYGHTGTAELGYGDGDEYTVVSFGPDPNNKYITTYFRHAFNVVDASACTKFGY